MTAWDTIARTAEIASGPVLTKVDWIALDYDGRPEECMKIRIGVLISRSVVLLLLTARLAWPQAAQVHPPIIDMHLHAHTLSMYGTPAPTICTNDQEISYPAVDPRAAACTAWSIQYGRPLVLGGCGMHAQTAE